MTRSAYTCGIPGVPDLRVAWKPDMDTRRCPGGRALPEAAWLVEDDVRAAGELDLWHHRSLSQTGRPATGWQTDDLPPSAILAAHSRRRGMPDVAKRLTELAAALVEHQVKKLVGEEPLAIVAGTATELLGEGAADTARGRRKASARVRQRWPAVVARSSRCCSGSWSVWSRGSRPWRPSRASTCRASRSPRRPACTSPPGGCRSWDGRPRSTPSTGS
jgi:hypothetical protein